MEETLNSSQSVYVEENSCTQRLETCTRKKATAQSKYMVVLVLQQLGYSKDSFLAIKESRSILDLHNTLAGRSLWGAHPYVSLHERKHESSFSIQ